MRSSEYYRRHIEAIAAIAKSQQEDWKSRVEFLVRQFHSETMPLARVVFRQLTEEMCRELERRAALSPPGTNREVFSFAGTLIRAL